MNQNSWVQLSLLLGFSLIHGMLPGQHVSARANPLLNFDLPPQVEEPLANPQVKPLLLSFALPRNDASTATSKVITQALALENRLPATIERLFLGGSDSVVARTVGKAEGTRALDGAFTWAYHGHHDPGNGKWNLGSFSYQHEASSPEDADQRQLKRLSKQTQQLNQLAAQRGMTLSTMELLNGIDLANQAPLAALDRGYIDWLDEAHQLELSEAERILYARTWSYWDPDLEQWNAPGLGNRWLSISEDQRRRQTAISQVMSVFSNR